MLISSIASPVLAALLWRSAYAGADELHPTIESARERAYLIFRAINNAGRQWGSSINHNGFGFFPAIVPAGTVMYHGSVFQKRPDTFEWLAFEIEHGEVFAIDVKNAPPKFGEPNDDETPKIKGRSKSQKVLGQDKHNKDKDQDNDDHFSPPPGYIHSYQATKDLHALYIDGMSAGKTTLGTMDPELYILYGKKNEKFEDDEWKRAEAICSIVTQWGYDGYIRMEIGFEYVHCDFSKDLDTVSVLPVHDHKGLVSDSSMLFFQWARAVAEDYDGVGSDRIKIDYSSMVSGLFYPLNITNTDPARPDLIRLASAGIHETQKIKPQLEAMSRAPRRFTVNWQAVTDTVVRRYANRLALMMSEDVTDAYLIDELETASRTHIAVPEPRDSKAPLSLKLLEEAIARCVKQPLLPATFKKPQWSREDEFIGAALEVVTENICSVILRSYNAVREATEKDLAADGKQSTKHVTQAAKKVHRDIKILGETLGWTQWKQVRRCPPGEMMLTVMWPLGNTEDYFNPGCQPIDQVNGERISYFRDNFPGGRPPRRHREDKD